VRARDDASVQGNHKGCPYVFIVAACAMLVGASQVPNRNEASTAGYVGAQTCARCHAAIHDQWTSGRHSKTLQPANAATVEGDFAKRSITLRGSAYGLRVRDGQYFITESVLTGKEQEHRIDYTLGSRRIQHYLTTTDKGRIIVLPPSWDVQRQEWFHNMEIVRPDEDDRQIVQQWNRNCVGCHVSGQDNGYDPSTRTYHTKWTDFGTSCERCHGPGQAHVEHYSRVGASGQLSVAGPSPARDGRRTQNPQNAQSNVFSAGSALAGPKLVDSNQSEGRSSAGIVRPTRLDPVTGTAVCAQCHSLRTAINPGYRAGDDYYDYFVPTLEYAPSAQPHASQDPPYWADGRPRRFSNDAMGLWQSACFLRGGATCTTCHTNPHLPDVDRNPQLAAGSSNTSCTRCHQEIGSRLASHTHHAPGSAGSSCVECHMPKTVVSIKATMRDHTIGVPAPENTVRFGIPNACTECHQNKPASWAAGVLQSWWPGGRRNRLVARAEAFTAARARRPEAIERLIAVAEDNGYDPLTRANAVGYLGRFVEPRAVAALARAARSDHPAIRTTAIAALREPGHGDPASRVAIKAGLSDAQRTVRIASLLTLIEQGGSDLTASDLARFRFVSGELAAWTRVVQDDPEMQRAQGIVHLLGGDFARAADALQISADLEPEARGVKFFLAVARLGQRRVDEARTLLKSVPRGDPFYEKAQDQLKKIQ